MGLPGQQTLEDFFGQDGGEDADDGTVDRTTADKATKPGNRRAAGQNSDADLAKRQQALRERLENLQKRLDEAGADAKGLDGAQNAMREAENALGQGRAARDDAVDAQGRAVDALREGAQKLAEAMRGKAKAMVQARTAREQEVKARQGQFGAADDTDPLGRPAGSERAFNPGARFDPMGVPAAERARRVLEELRRRLGEPARPREEMDYLERLLRRY